MTQTPDKPRWTDEMLDSLAAITRANAESSKQSEDRLNSFIFEAQRLFNRLGERQERLDDSIQTMSDAITRLTNISVQNSQEIREMQAEVRGLQIENRRILQRVFGDYESNG